MHLKRHTKRLWSSVAKQWKSKAGTMEELQKVKEIKLQAENEKEVIKNFRGS